MMLKQIQLKLINRSKKPVF